jgi:uncharacterized membrane protein YbhN (UPF0104 family)
VGVGSGSPTLFSQILRWLRRGALVLVSFAVLDYLVLPQIAGTRKALHLLGAIRPGWAIAGIALEAANFVCYSFLTRSVLPDARPRYSWLIRSDMTALGVSHLLPGGAATASTLRYRLIHEGGAPPQDTAVGMAVQGVGSTLVLAGMLWLALIASLPLLGLHPVYVTAAAIGAIVIAASFLALLGRSRPEAPAGDVFRVVVDRLPHRVQPRVQRALDGSAAQLHQLLMDKRGLRVSAAWAAGSWGLDAASLWVFLAAYHYRVNPDGLLVAYALANLLAVLPISPGGIGIIEGVLIPSLVGLGTPRGIAVLGVVSWRLFNFWAPIPLGGLSYVSLRTQTWFRRRLSAVSVN